jgi:uncharacterized membrane protein
MLIEFFFVMIGMFYVVFLPGYLATWVILPSVKMLDETARAVVSPALSIPLVFSSVILSGSVFGIYATSLVSSLIIASLPTVICLPAALLRRRATKS